MEGELNEELKVLIKRFDEAPDSRLFAPLADAYRKNGNLDKAIEICEEGLGRYPDYISARIIMGKCFYDRGASERAKTEFEKALALDSENMVALKFLGDIHLAEDDREKASDYYQKLLAIDPTNQEIKKLNEEITEHFKPRSIDLEDREIIEEADNSSEPATMTLAGIYAAQGYYAKAKNIYRSIIEEDPGNEEALNMLSKLESMTSSVESEKGEVFDDDVMTISLDDVTDEIAESTAGSGGGGAGGDDEEDFKKEISQRDEKRETADKDEESEEVDRKEAERSSEEIMDESEGPEEDEQNEEPQGQAAKHEMQDFLGWIKKMKEGKEKDQN